MVEFITAGRYNLIILSDGGEILKIEMGESLIYSWLRHEKQCQLTQTNWKPSHYWVLENYNELNMLLQKFDQHYNDKYGYDIFKGCSLDQLLKQAEIDVIGIAFSESAHSIYAVDIAYHEAGLNYGDKYKTISKIVQKCVRTALCLYGFFNIATGEIIFVSPKINPAIEGELAPLFEELTALIKEFGLEFNIALYSNQVFSTEIMQPIIAKGTRIADTSELFLRSVQLYQMFAPSITQTIKQVPTACPMAQQHPHNKSDRDLSGKALSRIPKWAVSPEQNNYKIIRAYFQILDEHGRVDRPTLEARCQDMQSHPDIYVRDFRGNFTSLKTDKGNSHGKVFIDDGYNITIWDALIDTLKKYRSLFLA